MPSKKKRITNVFEEYDDSGLKSLSTSTKEAKKLIQQQRALSGPQDNRIVLLTTAPFGCFGDIRFTKKLIKSLRKKNPDLKIDWIIHGTQGLETFEHMIPDYVEVHAIPNYSQLKYEPKLWKRLSLAHGIIISPTFAHLDKKHYQFLKLFDCPRIAIAELNVKDVPVYKAPATAARPYLTKMFWTGLGDTLSGLFLGEPKKRKLSLSQCPDKSFIAYLLDIKSTASKRTFQTAEKTFFNQNDLYFGYTTLLYEDQVDKQFRPHTFINQCLQLSLNKRRPKDIVVVMPFTIDNKTKEDDITDIQNHLAPYLDKVAKVSFCKLHPGLSKIDYHSFKGHNPKGMQITIINPFPIPPKVFKTLLRASEPFVALTGDQSLTEGLKYHKWTLYQRLTWKKSLFDNLIKLCNKVLGIGHPLTKFYRNQLKKADNLDLSKPKALSEGAKQLAAYMNEHCNINKTLTGDINQMIVGEQNRQQALHLKRPTTRPTASTNNRYRLRPRT